MATLLVQDATGHRTIEFDKTDEESVEKTRREFDELIEKGYLGYVKTADGNEQIRSFDQTAEETVMAAPLVGG